jgi:[acyl-carrier-protein] S-malonyltransferase
MSAPPRNGGLVLANGGPMRTTALLFPGQGSLTPDAGERARAAWPELVDRAAALLGEDPFAAAPHSTAFAQPAIFVASMAAWSERREELGRRVCAMAGHSLGELSALAAAGALEVDHALRLVILRGRLMADAAEQHPGGGMVALLGAEPAVAAELAERFEVAVANDNAPGQLVLSGNRARLDRAVAAARDAGVRTLELDVAGAFHSRDMAPAELPFLLAVEDVALCAPRVPVVSGFTARPFSDVPLELSRAVVSPVRWRETMQALVLLGAGDFVDIGPGRVLERLVKRNVAVPEAGVVAA